MRNPSKRHFTVEGLAHTLRLFGVTVWTPRSIRRHALYVGVPSAEMFVCFALAARWRWRVALRNRHGGLIYGIHPHCALNSGDLPAVFDAFAIAARVNGADAADVAHLRAIARRIKTGARE